MALVLNQEQLMLKDAARDFLSSRAPVSHLRDLRDSGNQDGFSRELWAGMVEMGWAAIVVPEAYGGLEYGYTGMGILLEESGRTLTPSPLSGTALTGVAALTMAGSPEQCMEVLPAVTSGAMILALAVDEGPRHEPGRAETEAAQFANGFHLSGKKTAVVDGHVADRYIVSASTGKGISLFLVPADANGITVERYPVLDTHAGANVLFEGVELGPDCLLGTLDQSQPVLDNVLDVARIGASAEMLGIARESFDRTVAYLKERKQFGKHIGSFQALQHRAAKLFGEIEMCKSLLLKALQMLDQEAGNCAEIASLTKAKLSETTHLATTEAIQMHGGIGMTDDFDIGFFLKRYRVLETLYGDRYFHLDRFARQRGY
jgi:alkylation response protein AidB-like acyl-CoA dehydrogenase